MPLSQFRAYKSQQILVYCAVAGTALIIPRMRLAQPLPDYLINIKAIMHHTTPKSISYLCAKITNLEAKFPVRLKFAKTKKHRRGMTQQTPRFARRSAVSAVSFPFYIEHTYAIIALKAPQNA